MTVPLCIKIKAAGSSKKQFFFQTTWRHIPEAGILKDVAL